MVTQQTEYKKPLPRPTPVSVPFWEGAKRHRLLIQRCRRCANVQFYPRPHCITCLADELEWVEASGRGSVYSYTIVRRPASPAFEPDVPYVLAVIELAEGPHMTGNIDGIPPEGVRVGMPVRPVFDDVTPEVTLIKWRPE